MNREIYKIYIALIILFTVILIGIVGFISIEDFTLVEAFFMTIITISTVGFREVHPLSPSGQIFTAILIIMSFGIFVYAITTITRYILDGEIRNYYKNYRVNKNVEKLKDHIIICGYGRNGKQAATEFAEEKHQFVIVENEEDVVEQLRIERQLAFFQGDATREEVLNKVNISKAKALITTLPNDADNLFVVLTARELNKDLMIISRASRSDTEKKLKKAGADTVVMPDIIGGEKMAKLVTQPDIVEFLDYIMLQSHFDVNIEEITCSNINTAYINQSIKELIRKNDTGSNIIGVKISEGDYIFNPTDEIKLTQELILFTLGTPDQIKKLKAIIANG
jgi:voltage-gated potassium channel